MCLKILLIQPDPIHDDRISMKTVAVANPHACNGRVGRHWADYARSMSEVFGPLEFCHTTAPGQMTLLVRQAIHAGAERIVVVGGDGSVNEAVNGFFENEQPIGAGVTLAVWPVGTGCDFARSIGLSGVSLAQAYTNAAERRIDVGKASFTNLEGHRESRYFLNISSCGSSGLIADKVNKSHKWLGSQLSYYIGTLHGLMAYRNQRVRLRVDDKTDEMLINSVAVANGRYFGGGMMIAPHASLENGALDIVVVGNVGMPTFLKDSPLLYKGKHLAQPYIRSFRGSAVEVIPLGDTPVLLECDGEQVGRLPVRYEILPQALRLFGPGCNKEANKYEPVA
jgi:diacylglycerol kinase (ATP)